MDFENEIMNEDEMMDERASESDTDQSDGESEKCAICLNKFIGQDIGIPENCNHIFCLECIQEWSKKVNTCPVDRIKFNFIFHKEDAEGKVIATIPVDNPDDEDEGDGRLDNLFCEICGRGDREDSLLLCDGCDRGFHCECLFPPLDTIPIEQWFCPQCRTESPEGETSEVPEATRHGHRRAIARTATSETVRSRIQRRRTQGTSVRRGPSTSRVVRRKIKVKRKTKTKSVKRKGTRKTTKKTKISRGTTKGKKKRKTKKTVRRKSKKIKRKKRTSVRSAATTRPLAHPTVKTRIAKRLGMENPPPGHTLPVIKKPGAPRSLDSQRSDLGISELSIFGNKDELLFFDDGTLGEDKLKKCPSQTSQNSRLETPSTSGMSKGVDLLGSIMQDQCILHTNSQNVKINQNGVLSLKPSSKICSSQFKDSKPIVSSSLLNNSVKDTASPPNNDCIPLPQSSDLKSVDVKNNMHEKTNICLLNSINKSTSDKIIPLMNNYLPLHKQVKIENTSTAISLSLGKNADKSIIKNHHADSSKSTDPIEKGLDHSVAQDKTLTCCSMASFNELKQTETASQMINANCDKYLMLASNSSVSISIKRKCNSQEHSQFQNKLFKNCHDEFADAPLKSKKIHMVKPLNSTNEKCFDSKNSVLNTKSIQNRIEVKRKEVKFPNINSIYSNHVDCSEKNVNVTSMQTKKVVNNIRTSCSEINLHTASSVISCNFNEYLMMPSNGSMIRNFKKEYVQSDIVLQKEKLMKHHELFPSSKSKDSSSESQKLLKNRQQNKTKEEKCFELRTDKILTSKSNQETKIIGKKIDLLNSSKSDPRLHLRNSQHSNFINVENDRKKLLKSQPHLNALCENNSSMKSCVLNNCSTSVMMPTECNQLCGGDIQTVQITDSCRNDASNDMCKKITSGKTCLPKICSVISYNNNKLDALNGIMKVPLNNLNGKDKSEHEEETKAKPSHFSAEKKLKFQEEVVKEIKAALKPFFVKEMITKEDYKEILRRSVPKVCQSRSGEICPSRIQNLVFAYVMKFQKRT